MSDVPVEIIELVNKFERNIEAYKDPSYKEEQLKQEFINPFFKALGWDVDNTAGAAPQYRDVIFEDSIKVSGGTRAPDYCFTLAGRKMFFVEAKKPSVNIDKDIKPSYQLRRYAWSAKLPLSILTDFEEFAIYDSRTRPKKTDRTSTGRIKYFTYKDYVEQWDFIYNTFSKDAVFKGTYDKYAESTKKKKGTTLVDDEFLSEIESWRELLAKEIALKNSDLTVDELNYSVQQIIDRIIFLRMGEDRGAEKYGQLRNLLDKPEIYQELCELWKEADQKYNSGLFHFKDEKGQNSLPDILTPHLKIKDGVFKQIIKNLYYPDSPYEFSVLSPEILGNVYEQFLGKVIRLTQGHRAKIEEKPEVKKAGGVYYTPQYIVEYIVKNTVGKLCEGKTPQKVSELRILDPACGSGSFLLGAYNYLLNWHHEYYINLKNKNRLKDQIYKGKNNEWHLTVKEKKRILLNNIYGVDIDHQAVEVTKLSLLLKVLEGENKDVIEAQQKLFKERALPNLEDNIKCGNSLIGPEIYDDSKFDLKQEDIKRINPFDWKNEFSDVFNNGGFDTVIGNPPYIRIQAMKEWAPIEVEFYKEKYYSASKGNYDIYVVFVEKGLELLNEKGLMSYILPHKFFNAKYGQQLRLIISDGENLNKVVHFGDQQVFENATTYTCLLFLSKSKQKKFSYVKVEELGKWRISKEAKSGIVSGNKVKADEWNFFVGPNAEILNKLQEMPIKLGNITKKIFQGLITGSDPVFLLNYLGNDEYYSDATNKKYKLEKELMHPLCKGSVNLKRYHVSEITKHILFPYKIEKDKAVLLSKKELSTNYSNIWNYLNDNKKLLESRERGKWKNDRWYALGRTQNLNQMEQIKILTPSIANSASYSLDLEDYFYFVGSGGGGGGGYGIILQNTDVKEYQYILGLLNSKLLDIYLKECSSRFRGGYFAYNKQYIEKLPIPELNTDPNDITIIHDSIVTMVEKMLQLHKDIDIARTPQSKELIQRQIDATDKQIDKLVYELYGLTEDEIKIVEEMNEG
ncbi:Type II site-specific deoxyribonuclease [Methanobacterium lacus]|uniref:site-specific DNA-methyltransferase (adenine-specific) n=1 Tax=Methanobacterium lacus (strain AL-21) TaxID=877455 RepID=F0TCA1_METLA|nr:N-6 DNA methylase [Methanobacterium lacus]ADZ10368.1 Type II site-specific deoxyribonuclease [Methanobacterium lacus]